MTGLIFSRNIVLSSNIVEQYTYLKLIFFLGTTFVQFFLYCKAKKKFRSDPKKFFLKIYLTILKKKNFQNFSDRSEIFFCFTILKKLNKSCSLEKNFLFLKKKVGSLKKTSFSFFSKGHIFGISILVSQCSPIMLSSFKSKIGNVFLPMHL